MWKENQTYGCLRQIGLGVIGLYLRFLLTQLLFILCVFFIDFFFNFLPQLIIGYLFSRTFPVIHLCLSVFLEPLRQKRQRHKRASPSTSVLISRPIYIYILTSFSIFAGACMCAYKDTLVSGRHNNVFCILHFGQQGDGSLLCHDQSSQGLRPVLLPLQRDFALHHSNTRIII